MKTSYYRVIQTIDTKDDDGRPVTLTPGTGLYITTTAAVNAQGDALVDDAYLLFAKATGLTTEVSLSSQLLDYLAPISALDYQIIAAEAK
ncbi:hypothetical protein [Lacticaseibacillus mingshuiensis]|uniref:Uncharacterized protein n=1 Tax=Lacticaseibacillus mingshuiensis TaxID=2799574 RepID=A0ABW4CH61_9LACO|nr:hypothetical protein [Lacticaseibacillus mingshuiensis]